MKRFWTRMVFVALLSFCVPCAVFAQDGVLQEGLQGESQEEPDVENGDPGDGDGSIPLDGGLSLLLAAGAAYGAYRLGKRAPVVVVEAVTE
jgi:hypothetical protein